MLTSPDVAVRRDFLERFLGLYLHDPAVGLLRAEEAALIAARELPAPLLDLGCGDGTFARHALARAPEVGVDRDHARALLASGSCRAAVVADVHRLPFRDGAFGSVLSNSTLEHIPGPGDVLREAARVLRPGGKLLFTVHNHRFARRMFFWPALHRRLGLPGLTERYRRRRLRRLAMENLLAEAEWRALLERAGLETEEAVGYLAGGAERAFETLLVLGRFGLGRAHLGVVLRNLALALDRLGVRLHRRLAGRLLARLLEARVRGEGSEPAALLFEARRRAALAPVVALKPQALDVRVAHSHSARGR